MEIIDNQSFDPNFPDPAAPQDMTEDEVKKLFVPFLREFYKYRYAVEPGSRRTTFDNVGEGGIIADGKITFLKTDNEDPEKRQFFTCTFEATSRDKMAEIKYEPNIGYLIWDGFAFAAATTAGFYILSYILRTGFLYGLGAAGNLGMVCAFGMIAFSVWFFLMKNWRKYRYIFAINQFKQYFADEQWCAIAGDIFYLPTDPFLMELKDQCMFNGFGLAIVERDGEVRQIATPSRLGMYGRDRKMIDLVAGNKVFQTISGVGKMREKMPDELTVAFNKIWKPVQFYLLSPIKNAVWKVAAKPFGLTSTMYSRWKGGYETQKSVFVLSVFAMSFFLYKTLQHKDLEEAGSDYSEKIGARILKENPENYRGYIVDGEAIKYGAIPKQYPGSELSNDDDVQTVDLSGNENEAENVQTVDLSGDGNEAENVQTIDLSGDENEDENPEKTAGKTDENPIVFSPTKKPRAASPCNLLSGKKGWIVQDGYFSDKTFADERLAALKHRGLKAFAAPGNCVDRSAGLFIFWGNVFPNETAARNELDAYRKTLARYSLLFKKPPILREIK